MTKTRKPSLKDPKILLLAFFGAGHVPVAPGTVGTLAVIPMLILASLFEVPLGLYIAALVILTVISCFAAERAQQQYHCHDPSWIVIDEVIGMATTWAFLTSLNWQNTLLAFILFRLFDIIKIWPASYFDRKMTHGAGTIGDDVISGFYAGICCLLVSKFIPFFS